MTDFLSDTEDRYEAALERREGIYAEWQAEGCPLLGEGSQGQLVEHPYIKMLRDHDLLLDRIGSQLRKAHRGPQLSI